MLALVYLRPAGCYPFTKFVITLEGKFLNLSVLFPPAIFHLTVERIFPFFFGRFC